MDQEKKKIMWWVGGTGVILLAAMTASLFFNRPAPNPGVAPVGLMTAPSPRSAYQMAIARAEEWRSDAALVKVVLDGGDKASWTYTFVSEKAPGKGFEVSMNGQSIGGAQEVPFMAVGATLPASIVSPEDALAKARAVPGYAGVNLVSMEMVYDANAHQWYWGVKTSDGRTITVKATQ